jgi:hypothetical protein
MWRVLLLGLHLETLLAESLFDVLDIIIFICFGVINGSLRAKHTDYRCGKGRCWILLASCCPVQLEGPTYRFGALSVAMRGPLAAFPGEEK